MPPTGAVLGSVLTPVDVLEGAQVKDINFMIARAAMIRGRITSDAGAPLAHAAVRAERMDAPGPSFMLTTANDRGEYELRVPPGKFFVGASVELRPGSNSGARGNAEYAPTYYPGVVSKEDGAAIEVNAGDAAHDVNIALLPRVSHTITGRVTAAGVLVEGVRLSLVSSTGSVARLRTRADGSFAFVDLKPGRYVVWARPPAEDSDEVAWQAVDLGEAAVDLELPLAPGGRLRGRVVDEQGQPAPEGARVIAALLDDSRDIDPTSPDQVEIDADGAFDLAGLFGRRALRVIGLPAGWSVTTVLLNGRESPKEFKIVEGRAIEDIRIVTAPR